MGGYPHRPSAGSVTSGARVVGRATHHISMITNTDSSFIEAYDLNPIGGGIVVRIRGVDHHYPDVSRETIAAFRAAPSKGAFFNKHIRVKRA